MVGFCIYNDQTSASRRSMSLLICLLVYGPSHALHIKYVYIYIITLLYSETPVLQFLSLPTTSRNVPGYTSQRVIL